MELNFNKNMIVSSKLKRLFWQQTTPVDMYPAFTNLTCRLAGKEEVANALCVMKLDAVMKEYKCNVLTALEKLMEIYKISKVSEFKLVMAKNVKGQYLPIKVGMVLKDLCLVDGKISCIYTDIRVSVQGNKCLADKLFSESLYNTDWSPVVAENAGCTWKDIDIEDSLWYKRSVLLREWREYITAKYNNLPLPPDNNVVFVVLAPVDTLQTTAWKSEGANDIRVEGFGFTFEDSEDIYNGIIRNEIAIIREDLIEHPTAKDDWVRVYTCCKVNLIKVNREITNGTTNPKCEVPIIDSMVLHMGEINLVKDVVLSWGYGVKVNNIEVLDKDSYVNTFQDVKIRVELAEVYGSILNYTLTVIDKNMDNLVVDTSSGAGTSISIPNEGCPCKF